MNKLIVLSILLFFSLSEVAPLKNYIGTEIQKCINCLCHARTGCFSRFNCASYSIGFEYWKTAGSPVVNPADDPDSQNSYQRCMQNENCILGSIIQYADAIGHKDCNCDGVFDCKDRLAIHLYGADCDNPKFTQIKANRYNSCVRSLGYRSMKSVEGYDGCVAEVLPE